MLLQLCARFETQSNCCNLRFICTTIKAVTIPCDVFAKATHFPISLHLISNLENKHISSHLSNCPATTAQRETAAADSKVHILYRTASQTL